MVSQLKAAEGFARKQGVSLADFQIRDYGEREVYFYQKKLGDKKRRLFCNSCYLSGLLG